MEGLLNAAVLCLQSVNNLMTAFAKLDVPLPPALLLQLHDCVLQRSATATSQVGTTIYERTQNLTHGYACLHACAHRLPDYAVADCTFRIECFCYPVRG